MVKGKQRKQGERSFELHYSSDDVHNKPLRELHGYASRAGLLHPPHALVDLKVVVGGQLRDGGVELGVVELLLGNLADDAAFQPGGHHSL
jgi:hypothetical protein